MRTALAIPAPLWRVLLSAVTALSLLSLAALLAACGGGGDSAPAAPPSEASAVIGAAGGTLDGPDGSRVEIPPGALSRDTPITIARRDTGASTATPDGYNRGVVYEFTPHDIVFAQPVTLRIPAQADAQAADQAVFRAGLGEPWQSIGGGASNGFAQWQSASFSWYAWWACATSGSNPDPYPCSMPTGMTQVAATPAALTLTSANPQAAHRFFRVRETVTLQLTASYSAPADCGDARIVFKRRRAGDAAAVVLLDTVPTMTPRGTTRVNAQASHTVQLTDADNGSTMLISDFSCRRAYQPPSRINLPPERQRVGAYDVMVFDAQIAPQPVAVAPSVSQSPADQTVIEPASATFSAAVGGTPLPTMQWQVSGDGGASWSAIAGATAATYTTPATTLADDGKRFRLVATNSAGQATSNAATLTVNAAPLPPAPTVSRKVAAGYQQTCAIRADGAVLCWGYNGFGAVAGPTGNTSYPPRVVPLAGAATAVATGYSGSCAIHNGGTLSCWGDLMASWTPLAVAGATDVRALAVGDGHVCFTQGASRAVHCFGNNSGRQLGDGSITSTRTPVAALGIGALPMTGAVDVAAGRSHSCAAFDSGAVLCWGYNFVGETGSATFGAATDATPVPIGDAVRVAAGDAYSCAVKASGQVACWGRSDIAQFGLAGTGFNPSPSPTVSPTLSNVVAVAAGWNLPCARDRDGRVRCWGTGMFGNGQVNETRLTPTLVPSLTGVGSLAAGGFHQCALRDNATLACWGSNTNGQLATGDTVPRTTPTEVVVSGGFATP